MAILELKIDSIEAYLDKTSVAKIGCLSLKSNKSDGEVDFGDGVKTTGGVFLKGKDNDKDIITNYKVHMTNVNFIKKIYAPTEIIVVLNIFPVAPPAPTDSNGNPTGPAPKAIWYPLTKGYLLNLFQNKKVTLKTDDGKVFGDDFYVEDILPRYKKDSMFVMLRIYSPDHQMALTQASATFVGKRLGKDVLASELPKYFKPWSVDAQIDVLKKNIVEKVAELAKLESDTKDKSSEKYKKDKEKLEGEKTKLESDLKEKEGKKVSIPYSTNLKVLDYDKKTTSELKPKEQWKDENTPEYKEETIEHIIPYLVQYNEPFYDMLKRTTNRWGEFLFYEDGKLQVGYDDTQTVKEVDDWYSLNYCDLKSHLRTDNTDNTYDAEAAYDDNIVKSPIQKNPSKIKNLPGCSLDDGLDVWLMKTFASFFGNTKNIPTWIGNQTFDNLYNLAVQEVNNTYVDNELSKKYFKNEGKSEFAEYYGDTEFDKKTAFGFSQFTEINSKFKEEFYRTILRKEQAAIQKGICMNYDTTYPNLKLGQIIKVQGEEYLVIKVECETKNSVIISDDLWVVPDDKTPELHFKVTAVGRYQDETGTDKDNNFYPTMLPSGHIRTSGAQLAKVWDADDPLNQNRVRIHFAWQGVDTERKENPTSEDDAEDCASPWLVYATSAASKSNGIFGKHYKDDAVIVDFANGNVENPYIVGGLAMKGNKVPGSLAERDIVLTSPGGHTLRMDDGSGAGLTAFLAGILTPGYDILTTFFPGLSGQDIFKTDDNAKRVRNFEGGFQLTDKYGIYTISGSTDGRNVSIKSPWGDVAISAFTGISISAPNGDIEIKGKNVKIEAGNNLELVSGTNVGYSLITHKESRKATAGMVLGDIALAVAKKLYEKRQMLDFSFIRNAWEVIMRPVEGALTVKSNRYLKLAAGKDECDYPVAAFADQATIRRKKEDEDKTALRKGLKLSKGFNEVIGLITPVAKQIDLNYRNNYNICVDELNAFKTAIGEACKFDNAYTGHAIDICKTYDDLKSSMWDQDDCKKFKAEDIFDKDGHTGYKVTGPDDVSAAAVNNYNNEHNQYAAADLNNHIDEIKKAIIGLRKTHRKAILKAANKLSKTIYNFEHLESLTRYQILDKLTPTTHSAPKGYKEALIKAFSKTELGDSLYFEADANQKNLGGKYNTGENNVLAEPFKVLRRKAAILLLEGMGFKDEWRAPKIVNHNEVKIPRKFDSESLKNDGYWNEYVNSIVSVPKLSSTEYSILKKVWDGIKDAAGGVVDFDSLKGIWGAYGETKNWSDAKNGAILFTSQGSTYSLKKDIETIEGTSKENLTSLDDVGRTFNNFLTKLHTTLNGI